MRVERIPVTYLDLGPRFGEEILAFLNAVRFLPGIDVKVFGVEANLQYVEYCRCVFSSDPRVAIHHFAVGSYNGVANFYLEPKGAGSSIYGDKKNVGEPIEVMQKRFSDWLREENVLPETDRAVNIIKANIEGAEWDLINDMDRENLFDRFDILCGPGKRAGGWTGDMAKVPSIAGFRSDAEDILNQRGIDIKEWHGDCVGMFDMRGAVTQLIRQRGVDVRFESLRNRIADTTTWIERKKDRLFGKRPRFMLVVAIMCVLLSESSAGSASIQ